jgi:2-oxoglutarate dehydrogenase E1 component
VVWCQEEPQNQGAWLFIAPRIYAFVLSADMKLSFAGRPASAAPACGSPYLHAAQQSDLIIDALGIQTEQQGES